VLDHNERGQASSDGQSSHVWKWHWTNYCAKEFSMRYVLKNGYSGLETATAAGPRGFGSAGFISSPCVDDCGGVANFEVDCPTDRAPSGVVYAHLREDFSHVAPPPPKPHVPTEAEKVEADARAAEAAEAAVARSRAEANNQPPQQQPRTIPAVTDDGLPLEQCVQAVNPFLVNGVGPGGGRDMNTYPRVICLTQAPVPDGHQLTTIQGSEIWVASPGWFALAMRSQPR